METITLKEAVKKIKDNPFKDYVILLNRRFRLCLC